VTEKPAERVRVPPPDHHRNVAGGALRAAVFGVMDGLLSTGGIIAGLAGGGLPGRTVLLGGVATLIAGSLSMSAGEYTSVRSQQEATLAEVEMERAELDRNPRSEQAELAQVYRDRGVSSDLADAVAAELMAAPDRALRAHTQEELGVDIDRLPSPWVAASVSMVAFAIGAFVPLFPYIIGVDRLWFALVLGAAGLVVAGAVSSRFTTRTPAYAAFRLAAIGASIAAITWGIGQGIGTGTG
jgi:vacuolar iron transporter family protein